MYESQKKYIKDNNLVKLSIDIKKEIRTLFQDCCKRKGTTPTAVLKKAINEYIIPITEFVALKYVGNDIEKEHLFKDYLYLAKLHYTNHILEMEIFYENSSIEKTYTLGDFKNNWTNIHTKNNYIMEVLKKLEVPCYDSTISDEFLESINENQYANYQKLLIIVNVPEQDVVLVEDISNYTWDERKNKKDEYQKRYPASKGYCVYEYIYNATEQ